MQGQIGERQDECPRQLPGRPLEVAGDRGSRWMVAQGLACRDEGFDAVNLTNARTELGLQSASPRLSAPVSLCANDVNASYIAL